MVNRVNARRQVALPIDGRDDLMTKEIRGGKGQGLAVMQRLGLRVPPAFTVSTTVMRAFSATGELPKRLRGQLAREMEVLERKTGKMFGGRNNPLLVSVRSGAATSMEGMMDTILNLGMTHEVCAGYVERGDTAFGSVLYECMTRGWKDIIRYDVPNDPWAQLTNAIIAVMRSWDNPRARTYREHHGISHALGTAVNVQAMVYGNRDEDSGTGVVFSHNVNTGDAGMTGEFRPCAQGDVLVGGKVTPESIEFLKGWNAPVYAELEHGVKLLEEHEGAMVEVEFTVESGVLYFLQCRKAKASLEARITHLVHEVWAKRMKHEVALARVNAEEIGTIDRGVSFEPEAFTSALGDSTVIRGIAAAHGIAVGVPVFTSEEAVERAKGGEQVILVRPDTDPDDLPGMLVAQGVITQNGGATCHAAVTARALGKPAIVGAANTNFISFNDVVSMDGGAGVAVSRPKPVPTRGVILKKEVSLFAKWYTKARFPKPRYDPTWVQRCTYPSDLLAHVYLLELMAHEAKGTELAFEAEKLRCGWYTKTAECFLCYLVQAVKSELRHVAQMSDGDESRVRSFYEKHELSSASETVLCQYFTLAMSMFRDCLWKQNYGGGAWAVIAETALWFLEGKIGHTVFVDRVFDLQHNTGRVFDKHRMVVNEQEKVGYMLSAKKNATLSTQLERQWLGYGIRINLEVKQLRKKGLDLKIWR